MRCFKCKSNKVDTADTKLLCGPGIRLLERGYPTLKDLPGTPICCMSHAPATGCRAAFQVNLDRGK